jgi:hypothetical protein
MPFKHYVAISDSRIAESFFTDVSSAVGLNFHPTTRTVTFSGSTGDSSLDHWGVSRDIHVQGYDIGSSKAAQHRPLSLTIEVQLLSGKLNFVLVP